MSLLIEILIDNVDFEQISHQRYPFRVYSSCLEDASWLSNREEQEYWDSLLVIVLCTEVRNMDVRVTPRRCAARWSDGIWNKMERCIRVRAKSGRRKFSKREKRSYVRPRGPECGRVDAIVCASVGSWRDDGAHRHVNERIDNTDAATAAIRCRGG